MTYFSQTCYHYYPSYCQVCLGCSFVMRLAIEKSPFQLESCIIICKRKLVLVQGGFVKLAQLHFHTKTHLKRESLYALPNFVCNKSLKNGRNIIRTIQRVVCSQIFTETTLCYELYSHKGDKSRKKHGNY